jgi:hypothetical protein
MISFRQSLTKNYGKKSRINRLWLSKVSPYSTITILIIWSLRITGSMTN